MASTLDDFPAAVLTDRSGDLAAAASALMTDACKIGRLVAGVWSLQSSGNACRLFLDGGLVRLQSLGSVPVLVFRCTLPLSTGILPGDAIYVNGQLLLVCDTDKGCTGAPNITCYLVRDLDTSKTWFS